MRGREAFAKLVLRARVAARWDEVRAAACRTNALGAENSPRCSSVQDAGDSPKLLHGRSAALLQKVAGRGTLRGTARGRNKCFGRRELTTLLFLYGMLETRDFKNSSAAAPRRCSRERRDAENSAEPRGEASRRPWRPHDVCACRRAGGMRILPCGWEGANEHLAVGFF